MLWICVRRAAARTESSIEDRYAALGKRCERSRVFRLEHRFGLSASPTEHPWVYMQEECFVEPVEFWLRVQLLCSLNQFFDRALYFASIGYQEASQVYPWSTFVLSVAHSKANAAHAHRRLTELFRLCLRTSWMPRSIDSLAKFNIRIRARWLLPSCGSQALLRGMPTAAEQEVGLSLAMRLSECRSPGILSVPKTSREHLAYRKKLRKLSVSPAS